MLEKYYPDLYYKRVQDIDLKLLREKGIKGLLLDIDNTLVPDGKGLNEECLKWIEMLRAEGFKVCIVSNASRIRVDSFREALGIDAIHRAAKPASRSFITALKLIGLEHKNVAMVGDQLFTDIYGGNRLDILTILVKPIDKREFLPLRIRRLAERYVLKRYKIDSHSRSIKRTEWKRSEKLKRMN